MNQTRKEFAALFENVPLLLIGIFLFVFPLLFSIQMTEAFLLPKHLLLGIIVTLCMIALGFRVVFEGKIRLRTTPFDLPVLLFTAVVIISSFLSINRFDALTAAVPFLYAALLYYSIVNAVRSEKALLFVLYCLVGGAFVASVFTILSFFNIYVLPFPYTRSPFFTTIGTLLDQVLYLGLVLPISGYFAFQLFSSLTKKNAEPSTKKIGAKTIGFTVFSLVIAAGAGITLYYLLTSQKPLILPFDTGFQVAFATISQDAGRMLQSFLFGSGYGTFLTDFTRFKQFSYNNYQNLWSLTFLRSSSFVLELLATTGLLGVLSFFFLIFRIIREKTIFLPLLLAIVAAFLLPFSPMMITLFFILLGIFAVVRVHSHAASYQDVEFHLVALRHGLVESRPFDQGGRISRFLPGLFALVLAGLLGIAGYFTGLFTMSDITFQKSLVAASRNDGSGTYTLQRDAIAQFPYRDAYHRVFSQTNLALANSLAQQTPEGASPSAQTQQNILTLIQQSINAGRSATAVAPYTAMNWNNLSGVYRSLIGFGENADRFSVLTNQQAIALDPSNPQQYINLGGVYYQLGLWDEASRQFQIAINLKNDYANAYYNLGHALESKGDLQQALAVYQLVKQLTGTDEESVKQIDAEIAALTTKIQNGTTEQVAGAQTPEQIADQEAADALQVNQPPTQLPERNPRTQIPGPTISPVPTGTNARPSPTPGQ